MRFRIGFAALLLGAGAAVGVSVAGAPQTHAPRDPQIIDAQGYQKLVRQYRGKPLLINFWATWCEPCRDEYPMLNELSKEYAPKGLRVVGVNSDQDGDLILMRRFIARYKPAFPNYRKKPAKPEEEAEFTHAVLPEWRGQLPATFLYDKDGRLAGRFFGAQSRETYESTIRNLLGSDGGSGGAPQTK
jgi:cytochrome c biogenesis protein CcmG/thiol:disulfide interchange protein DsbE